MGQDGCNITSCILNFKGVFWNHNLSRSDHIWVAVADTAWIGELLNVFVRERWSRPIPELDSREFVAVSVPQYFKCFIIIYCKILRL